MVSKDGEGKGEAGQDKAQKSVSIFFGSRAVGSLVASYFTGIIAENYPHPTCK